MFRLADGRRLCFAEMGPPQGTPALMFHGIPGSRLQRPVDDRILRQLNLRLITFDRPGLGRSQRFPGRRVADWPRDVAQVLDALGITRCHVAGVSGGGPYALACAALLPERLVAAATIGGAPPAESDAQTFGIAHPARFLRFAALRSPGIARRLLGAFRKALYDPKGWDAASIAPLLSAGDARVLRDSLFASLLATDFKEAFRQGVEGVLDEGLSLSRPWGFSLGSIRVPVTIFHGTKDRIVPPASARWLAKRIPTSRLRLVRGAGHYDLPATGLRRIFEIVTRG